MIRVCGGLSNNIYEGRDFHSTVMNPVLDKDDAALSSLLEITNSEAMDTPIDSDGRTAILVAHAPSLEQLLKSWSERTANEHREKEKQGQRMAEEGKAPNDRIEYGERKQFSPQSKSGNCLEDHLQNKIHQTTTNFRSSIDNENNVDQTRTSTSSTTSPRRKVSSSEFDYEQFSFHDMPMDNTGAMEECELLEMGDMNEMCYSLSDYDPEDVIQMERQLASIEADKLTTAINNDFLLESFHAASDLKRELNGKFFQIT
ncbi:unnamed protein product [Angiostrongylus costaricensis]|uniref:ANK_REP_REGION domain-containing protein n=1 Tax=Angiostrongylus costaricensis TaxID=334426 RepID=A0A158PGX3_ANGCS|nr:unnamed protein product [Angiostrongylus costaricensis]